MLSGYNIIWKIQDGENSIELKSEGYFQGIWLWELKTLSKNPDKNRI